MCNKYVLVSIFFIAILFISCSDNQPSENNILKDSTFTFTDKLAVPDFEYWKNVYGTNGEVLYEDPIGNWWTTLNKLKLITGPVTATKTTDAHSGNYALRLETMSYGSFIITGLLMTGVFDPNMTGYVIQGKSFTAKPTKFTGYYKYYPANHDTCSIYIGIYKYNQTLMRRDTIADAYLTISDSVTQYAMFELKLNYKLQDVVPDTLKIAIISSAGGENYTGHGSPQVGSTLIIDDLSLEIPTGIIYLMDEKSKSLK